MCGGFFHTKQVCNVSWVLYNLTQFWNYLSGDDIKSHRLRAQSHGTAPHIPCQSQEVGLLVIHNFCTCGWKLKIPIISSLGFHYLLEQLTEIRETVTYIYWFIKRYDKGYKWIARRRNIHVKIWYGPECSSFCPHKFEVHHLTICGCFHQPGSSPDPIQLKFLWKLLHVGMINY